MRVRLSKYIVALVAFAYVIVAWFLFVLVENRYSAAIPREGIIRVVIPVLLVYGFPVVVMLAWILSGKRKVRRLAIGAIVSSVLLGLIWLANSSLLANQEAKPYFIAHRGVHPVMDPEHNDPFTCVSRILPPEHRFIGNTLPSIQAAFDYGARVVEVDIQATRDGNIAVFHDGMLDCKTEASGPIGDRTMQELRSLDVGYGYVTDTGETPLRGLGVGMMRSLGQVLDEFPDREFLIDPKFGNNERAWMLLMDQIAGRAPEDQARLIIGADIRFRWVNELKEVASNVRVVSSLRMLRCVRGYMMVGWSGYVPGSCRDTMIVVYPGMGPVLWGWPRKFSERMEQVGTIVSLIPGGRTEQEHARSVPVNYAGGIFTDRIEVFPDWMRAGQE